MTASTFHAILAKAIKPITTPTQKRFNQLQAKIKALQEEQKKTTQKLDTSLQFYYAKIRPQQESLLNILIERTIISYQFYRAGKDLSKSEFKLLKKLIIKDVNTICAQHSSDTIPVEIKNIFKELNGIDYDTLAAEKLAAFKVNMQQVFEDFGTDIDLSRINMSESEEEIIEDIFRSMGKSFEKQKSSNESHKKIKKRKKLQEKEVIKQSFLDVQKKSIGSIYKKLVFTLHPDLEQNSTEKIWKEELIKKLTSAYQNNDFYGLLAIEMEWANHSAGHMHAPNDEQFEVYNAILADQVRTLQRNIDTLVMSPKYMPIKPFFSNHFDGAMSLKIKYDFLKNDVQMSQQMVDGLKTAKAPGLYRSVIRDNHETNIFE